VITCYLSSVEQEAHHTRPRGLSPALWIILLLLLVYPLSTGPVIKLHTALTGSSNRDFLFVVYAPLIWLSRTCPPVEQFFDWYVADLWQAE
jgi:hypothetical protein